MVSQPEMSKRSAHRNDAMHKVAGRAGDSCDHRRPAAVHLHNPRQLNG